jgi:hypothetical protein
MVDVDIKFPDEAEVERLTGIGPEVLPRTSATTPVKKKLKPKV